MKKFEYETNEVEPEELFDDLNLKGSEGWEFITLVVLNKMLVNRLDLTQQPKQVTTFKFIYKREKL
jgi:hypothetical protein